MMRVSAGIVRREDGAILIAKRGEGRKNAHLWEFPGGKQETGETPQECLIRELQEELSLPVEDVQVLTVRQAEGIEFTFLTARTHAQPVLTEHEAFAFVPAARLMHYTFCPADEIVAQQLSLQGIRYCLWDFDGTLMDTYPLLTKVFCQAAREIGQEIAPEDALALMKNNLRYACEVVAARAGAAAEDMLATCSRLEAAQLLDNPQPIAGIPALLAALHGRGVKHYVVTHRELVCRDMLEKCGLLPLFDGFVTRENHLPRKPEPDMVHYCMTAYGLQKDACVMIGDRPLDTQAGRAAGVKTILLDADGRFEQEESADIRVGTAEEMQALLCPEWKSQKANIQGGYN